MTVFVVIQTFGEWEEATDEIVVIKHTLARAQAFVQARTGRVRPYPWTEHNAHGRYWRVDDARIECAYRIEEHEVTT